MKNFVIYKYTSPSGKSYVGQTCNMKNRKRQHKQPSSQCPLINRAIKKYGFENFAEEILLTDLTLDAANHWESYYIQHFNTLSPNGYNLCTGGLNSLHAPETKLKIGLAHKGRKYPPSFGEKIRQLALGNKKRLGTKHSDETKAKLSDKAKNRDNSSRIGRKLSQASIAKIMATKIKNGTLNVSSPESTQKRLETMRKNGSFLIIGSPEAVAKRLETKIKNGTNKHSDETKNKISESRKAFFEKLRKGEVEYTHNLTEKGRKVLSEKMKAKHEENRKAKSIILSTLAR